MRYARPLAVLLLALAAGGCGLNPRQQTTVAGDALDVLGTGIADAAERGVITPDQFHATLPPLRAAKAAWDDMDAHADDVGSAVALSPWFRAWQTWQAEYAKAAAARSAADRPKRKPLPVESPAVPTGPPAVAVPPLPGS